MSEEARNMNNYKPFRTKAQKAEARRLAVQIDGRWVSTAPVSRHASKELTLDVDKKKD